MGRYLPAFGALRLRRETMLALRSILEEYLKKCYKEDIVTHRRGGSGLDLDAPECAKHFLDELKKNDKQVTNSKK
jgi:hypothetical protein